MYYELPVKEQLTHYKDRNIFQNTREHLKTAKIRTIVNTNP